MSNLYIIEFAEMGTANFGKDMQAPKYPPIAKQSVAIGASSTQSATF